MQRKVLGVLRFFYHFCFRKYRSSLHRVVEHLSPKGCSKDKKFVLTVGFAKSGKTTFIKSTPSLSKYFCISSVEIHKVLNDTFDFLHDDKTIEGFAYWERQVLTWLVRRKLLEISLKQGCNIINDSANLIFSARRTLLRLAKGYGYHTTIIYVVCSEKLLIERLSLEDDAAEKSGKKRVWVDLYFLQKKMLTIPNPSEADTLIIYEGCK